MTKPVINLDEVAIEERPPFFQPATRSCVTSPWSTMSVPETVEYLDSGKVATYSRQTAPDGSMGIVRQIGRAHRSRVDYWEGE